MAACNPGASMGMNRTTTMIKIARCRKRERYGKDETAIKVLSEKIVKGGGGIRNWRDFLTAADLARPVLGISPSAWEDARVALGEQQAAITIAAIYQKSDQIKSPGGYLRNLTERAKEGKFSAWPMIMALLR